VARKKQQNIVRTDYLENWIGFYRAHGYRSKADAFSKIARDIGAPVSVYELKRMEEIHKSHQLELFTGFDRELSTPV
jgi:hypothetical protein